MGFNGDTSHHLGCINPDFVNRLAGGGARGLRRRAVPCGGVRGAGAVAASGGGGGARCRWRRAVPVVGRVAGGRSRRR